MREIGGYIELDTYSLPMLHEEATALNCARNALVYLIHARHIRCIWLPKLLCDSISDACDREGIEYKLYTVGSDFLPTTVFDLNDDEWLYIVNYYGQLTNEIIREYRNRYTRIIIDNAQSYFQMPVEDVDTIYSCRKYFGVADGAFLYTDTEINVDLQIDESFNRMHFLLGRFERTASEFYDEYVANNDFFVNEPIKQMSKLTNNLLHGIDYKVIEERRKRNFGFLHSQLKDDNKLMLHSTGTFMYPLLINNGSEIRKKLQREKIYIPTLWPSVFKTCKSNDIEYQMAENILPLPIDQRYGIEDMDYMVQEVQKCIS